MKYNRRSLRLKGYDYTQEGVYFITICTFEKWPIFGDVVLGAMELSDYGRIVYEEWEKTAVVRDYIILHEFIVMPNHVHGIIEINQNVGARRRRALRQESFGKPVVGSVGTMIRSFKAEVTKRINKRRNIPGGYIWQRNYYEHIIRDDKDFARIRQYILANPSQWETDEYHF